ncbi:MAG: helix-turn-helix domain-containing protein [Planctomycetaceae bacterium]|nr:helix-turn-helix domain-containing protein [Planctomycetaceae bacterium]
MARKKLTSLTDQIRKAVTDCGESRYRISQQTGISQSTLAKFIGGAGLSMESLDLLAAYLELEVISRRKGK